MSNFVHMDDESINKLVTLKKAENEIYVMTLLVKTFTMDLFRAINYHLDFLEFETDGPMCQITTANHPKIFSAGMNFDNFKGHPDDVHARIRESCRTTARLLSLGFPTIAQINGECYAAGFFFACAHDFRIMRNDYGNICISEINIGMEIPPGMVGVVAKKIPHHALVKATHLGHKFPPKEALENHMVDKIVPMEKLMEEGLKFAREIKVKGKNRRAYGLTKKVIYANEIEQSLHKSVIKDNNLMRRPKL